jgi:hypothetical protein
MNTIKYLRNLVWIVALMILPYSITAANAPITTIATITACPGSAITVPVTVVDFTAISSFTLRIDFNSTVMQFNASATSFNAVFGSNIPVFACAFNPLTGLSAISITWNDLSPKTLLNGSTLVFLGFNYFSGPVSLTFNDIDSPGCEYASGMPPLPLTDLPTSAFYHNGQVSSTALAGSVAGGSTIYYGSGTGTLTLSGYSGSVLKWQKQYNEGAYTDIVNTAATHLETPVYTGIWKYWAVVQTLDGPVNSAYTTVTVLTPVGTSKTWTGATSSDWKTPTNWSPPGTPVAADNVIILSGTPPYWPYVLSTIVNCNNLYISNGAYLTINPANNLKVSGTLTIEGP